MRLEFEPVERAIWVDLLALAAKDDGWIRANEDTPYLMAQLAGLLVYPTDVFSQAVDKFVERGKLSRCDNGILRIKNWEKYCGTIEYRRKLKQRHLSRSPGQAKEFPPIDSNQNQSTEAALVTLSGTQCHASRDPDQIRSDKRRRGTTTANTIRLILDEEPKRWEGITDEDKALWKKTYPGCDIDYVLQEMISYWDAQPASKRKVNWKRTIVNRLKWLQDHGGTPGARVPGESRWLRMTKLKDHE